MFHIKFESIIKQKVIVQQSTLSLKTGAQV